MIVDLWKKSDDESLTEIDVSDWESLESSAHALNENLAGKLLRKTPPVFVWVCKVRAFPMRTCNYHPLW